MDVTVQPEIERRVLDRENLETRILRSLELAEDAPANLEWLKRNRAAYMGEWVALYKGRLIAHGKNGMDVFQAAQDQGINPPLMHRIIQEDPVSWGGW